MTILRIYFPGNWRDATTPCEWALCDDRGALLRSGIGTLASMPKGGECVGIVAPDRVLSVVTKMPPGRRRRWLASLPYLAETFTLADPEENHVVPGPALSDGRIVLVVVDKAWMKRVLEACRTAGLPLSRMIPETFIPQLNHGNWAVVWNGEGGFVRTGAAEGMAIGNVDGTTLPVELQLCLAEQTVRPACIEIRFVRQLAPEQKVLPQWQIEQSTLTVGPDWDWRSAEIPDGALNLMWGEFEPRAKVGDWWPKLRPAVVIALLVLGVEAAGANLEWFKLSREKQSLEQEMEHGFHAAFGDASVLVDAPLQMRRNLASLRHAAGLQDEGDFIVLLDAASPALEKLPAGSVRALHYETGLLDMDIRLGSAKELDELRQRLTGKGLDVQIGSQQGNETRLTLKPRTGL